MNENCLLLLVTTGMLAASAAGAEPLGTKADKPVTFLNREGGSVDPTFRPRKDRNRVFYAASLKQDRGWMGFTSIPNNPGGLRLQEVLGLRGLLQGSPGVLGERSIRSGIASRKAVGNGRGRLLQPLALRGTAWTCGFLGDLRRHPDR